MNEKSLPSTLQRVLAEFDEKFGSYEETLFSPPGYGESLGKKIEAFISQALTESLKEAFAVTESDVDIKAVVRWNIDRAEDIIDDARDELFDPKEHAMTGGIRSVAGGIKDSLEHILAALQAIEELKQKYISKQ